jgi:hypothetical protein
MLDTPPPPTEYAIISGHAVDQFVEQMCNNEKCGLFPLGCLSVVVAGTPARLCSPETFQLLVSTIIELILIDVRDGLADDLANGFAFRDFDAKLFSMAGAAALRPGCWWRCFVVPSYLRDLRCPSQSDRGERHGLQLLSRGPLFRFHLSRPSKSNGMTYGGRAVTAALCESLGKVNFQI